MMPKARTADDVIIAGRYEILRCLGHGPHGTVYICSDHKDRQSLGNLQVVVALKLLHEWWHDTATMRERVRYELVARKRPEHRNLVAVYDFIEDRGACGVTMEHVRGVNLQTLLREGPLPLIEAVLVLHQLADALSALHRYGIVHGHLHPRNVLVRDDGIVKVSDVGWYALASPTQQPPSFLRSPFCAPEYRATERGDFRADIFSLGMLGLHMTRYHPPTDAHDLKPAAVHYLTQQLQALLEKAAHRNLRERHQEITAFQDDLRKIIDAFRYTSISHLVREEDIAAPSTSLLHTVVSRQESARIERVDNTPFAGRALVVSLCLYAVVLALLFPIVHATLR
jgi:serine/threonine protein kinase